ncbi:hypothetical protein CP985_03405 [Malaciobacter mytili LMG 24559]|uniref:Transglycosylase SLT domain-containing protein n=1 Tax=Malaciobacter mytili LMG 24559 TaxID=1032238 RepID=A0AAX2AL67_9BACT|nr:hypothetical protein [Malaciobacter mytili]AXH16404.1 hypothetical protein AMYT_a0106 [Malaciobacter mytili LMG 24559]RXK16471.1 hypothetical protein CP985_03405 [Malaciobacter mytili LMG 24559]
MLKLLISLVIIISNLSSTDFSKCTVDYEVMELIAIAEKHKNKEVGYPYLISFNDSLEYSKLLKNHNFKKLDNRTLDCYSINNCTLILDNLISLGITNLDLGPYQFHYKSHKSNKLEEYFILEKSYMKACNFLEKLIKKYGNSYETLAKYHSSTEKFNKNYQNILIDILQNKQKKEQNL